MIMKRVPIIYSALADEFIQMPVIAHSTKFVPQTTAYSIAVCILYIHTEWTRVNKLWLSKATLDLSALI